MRNQPALFSQADTPIRLHSNGTATLQPQLHAVSPCACRVEAASLMNFTPPITLRPLTHVVLGRKVLWRANSPLNSPPKNRARLPRYYRFAHERNASWKPLSGPLPRGYSRSTARSEFSIHKHYSGKTSIPISIKKQVSRGVGAPALLSALSGPGERLPVKYSQDSADDRGYRRARAVTPIPTRCRFSCIAYLALAMPRSTTFARDRPSRYGVDWVGALCKRASFGCAVKNRAYGIC